MTCARSGAFGASSFLGLLPGTAVLTNGAGAGLVFMGSTVVLFGGTVVVAVDSAQPVSALLFAGTNAAAPVTIHRRTAARDHTERLLRWTGVEVIESDNSLTVRPGRPSPFSLTVPGDPSGAAFLGALHVASPRAGATLTVPGVGINARRTGFFDVLRAMGVVVGVTSTADTGPEPVGDGQPTAPSKIRSAASQRASAPSGQSRSPCSR